MEIKFTLDKNKNKAKINQLPILIQCKSISFGYIEISSKSHFIKQKESRVPKY